MVRLASCFKEAAFLLHVWPPCCDRVRSVSQIVVFSAEASGIDLPHFRPRPRWQLRGLRDFLRDWAVLTPELAGGGAVSKQQMRELVGRNQPWTGKKFFAGG